MTDAGLRRAATAGALSTAAVGVAVFWLAVQLPALGSDEPARSVAVSPFVMGMTVLAGTGALLVRQRPRSGMGWLMVATGVTGVLARLVFGLAVLADVRGHQAVHALGWLTNWAWVPMQALALLLLLRFPDGRLPSSRWRPVQGLVLLWSAAAIAVTALLPGPLGAEQLAPRTNPWGLAAGRQQLEVALDVLFLVQPLVLLMAIAGPVLRWRGAEQEERRQLTAVARACLLLAVAAPLGLASDAGEVLEGLTWLVLPASIAYAVLRHGLWDLEVRRRLDRLRLVREEERTRLQRDLHDSLGPMLGAIAMRAEAARNLLAAGSPTQDVDRILQAIGTDAERAVAEVRRFIDELRPSALADTDLATALHALAADHQEAGLTVAVTIPDELPTLKPAAEVALYRVASEALRNVQRHAQAERCRLTVRVDGPDVLLEVVDDGLGLRGQPPGVGRTAMAERVAALGGDFALREPPGGGVHLSARLAEAQR
jgi:signal transduction histidine kinase